MQEQYDTITTFRELRPTPQQTTTRTAVRRRRGRSLSSSSWTIAANAKANDCQRAHHDLRTSIFHRCEHEDSPDIDVRRLRANPYLQRRKRIFDIIVASLLLLGSLPAWLLIALAIKFDSPGPVLFKQDRTGLLGRRFRMFKFRTMVADAEQRKKDLMDKNIHGHDSPDFKVVDDPRITRIGGFLRKTSLDELPNLLNVLKGDMSMVGPRPTSFHASTYGKHHLSRLAIKPGITGLWQVSGRADVDFNQRTFLDVDYINRASLIVDMALLLRTPFKICSGAY